MRKKLKVLVIDDCHAVLNASRTQLEGAGYEVVTRSRSIGTGAAILREQPDLVVIDVNMPLLSGDELVRMLRSNTATSQVPALLFSEQSARALRALVRASGASGYIRKTDSLTTLLPEIERWRVRLETREDLRMASLEANGNRTPGGTALFVDDDTGILDGYRRVFGQKLKAEYQTSGFQALQRILSDEPPAAVVSDVIIPDLSGADLYDHAVRADASWQRRFVFVSGNAFDTSSIENAQRDGVPIFFKPVEVKRLDFMLRQLCDT